MKAYERIIFASNITLPQQHCCETQNFFVGSDRYHATMNIHFAYCVSLYAQNMECPIVYTVNNGVRIN